MSKGKGGHQTIGKHTRELAAKEKATAKREKKAARRAAKRQPAPAHEADGR